MAASKIGKVVMRYAPAASDRCFADDSLQNGRAAVRGIFWMRSPLLSNGKMIRAAMAVDYRKMESRIAWRRIA